MLRPPMLLLVSLLVALTLPSVTLAQTSDVESSAPGFLVIEIDGLSEPRLNQAFDEGSMPFLASLAESGSHIQDGWDTVGSSTTPVSQAGLLHGDSSGVPGYRWWDRETGRLIEASNPDDAMSFEQTASGSRGLLADDGASITNIVSGGAERTLFTVSHMTRSSIVSDTVEHLLDPPRAAGFVIGFADAIRDAAKHRLNGDAAAIDPAGKRKVALPVVGPALESALVDVTTMAVVREIEQGVPVLYASLLSYDEVAHYAGPSHPVATDALRRIDTAIATIHAATSLAPRPYHLIVLSDHGQTQGRPFELRYGATLDDVIRAGSSPSVDPVVAGSGNLAHVYLARSGDRSNYEAIEAAEPGLVQYLASHPGIGVVVVQTALGHLLAIGPDGRSDLTTGDVADVDPLEIYGEHAAASLRHIASHEAAGDLVIISTYDPVADEVMPFERQVSSHGGLGGAQTQPLLLYPAVLEPDAGPLSLVGADAVHAQIREWIEAEASAARL